MSQPEQTTTGSATKSGRSGGVAAQVIGAQAYSLNDQTWFSRFSGDCNPLHVDPLAARRELYGQVVVHGIHGVLTALDHLLAHEAGAGAKRLARLKVKFQRPVFLDRPISTVLAKRKEGQFQLHLFDGEQKLATIDGTWGAEAMVKCAGAAPGDALGRPRVLELDELAGRTGALPLWWMLEEARARWAALGRLSPDVSAALCALTRLVGMECPGLRSVFSSFELRWDEAGASAGALQYAVTEVDPRFSLVRMQVQGAGVAGEVECFYRPAPPVQPSFAQVQQAVTPGEFAGVRALVVGGSRGIGEVTAKLIAAGGGAVVVTYQRGEAEAQAIVRELRAGGATAEAAKYEVGAVDIAGLQVAAAKLGGALTQAYYFPSPRIFVKQGAGFDAQLMARFSACYVDGFAECSEVAKSLADAASGSGGASGGGASGSGGVTLFYPSSVALDAPVRDMMEYSAAKAAGETLCVHLAQFDKRLRVLVNRLPRIATDQTLTLAAAPAAPALEVMLPLVRQMVALGAG